MAVISYFKTDKTNQNKLSLHRIQKLDKKTQKTSAGLNAKHLLKKTLCQGVGCQKNVMLHQEVHSGGRHK